MQYEGVKSLLMKVAWVAHTRPAICCVVAKCAQVTDLTFSVDKVRGLNKAVRTLKADSDRGITVT